MKAPEIAINSAENGKAKSSLSFAQLHRSAKYQKAHAGRKQPIRGLWIRNGKYVARVSLTDSDIGKRKNKWVPLKSESGCDITLIGQARTALRKLLDLRDEGLSPAKRRTPKFFDFLAEYWSEIERKNLGNSQNGLLNRVKRPATISKERSALKLWERHIGETRLADIRDEQLEDFVRKRQKDRISNRTICLDLIALRNVLKLAIQRKHLRVLPSADTGELRWLTPKRQMVSLDAIQRLCDAAKTVSKNGSQFSDYILLMTFCGSRRNETLRLKWSDVKWGAAQLAIGWDRIAKNSEVRYVDFNPQPEAHLKEMHSRKAPDSDWIFPSPQRGNRDDRAKTFRETLSAARKAADLPEFWFHDCRHFFVSVCVMGGIDYMTIAEWVGHKDGGVLIGKVYGHLHNSHRQRMAEKVVFSPHVIATATA